MQTATAWVGKDLSRPTVDDFDLIDFFDLDDISDVDFEPPLTSTPSRLA